MIGVYANLDRKETVSEFFELFKTPWEFALPDKKYEVAIVSAENFSNIDAEIVFNYATRKSGEVPIQTISDGRNRLPVYTGLEQVVSEESQILLIDSEEKAVATTNISNGKKTVRVGFNLFDEVEFLLTEGQPVQFALSPTLDYHIEFIKNQIINHGLQLVEIPPIPHGFKFTVCLSHDVDHPRLNLYGFDHTLAGFFFRASIGSITRFVTGRISLRGLVKNCFSLIRYPFSKLGLGSDLWDTFGEYVKIEANANSTFFIIPFRNRPGKNPQGKVNSIRASKYGFRDVEDKVQEIFRSGKEIAVHGIDSWLDPTSGESEKDELKEFRHQSETGVRMHWLYYNKESPQVLEKAGFTYDSTFGYNQTPGYRAGTSQAFKALGTESLIEIPLHIMDTSLFYPSHLHLSDRQAKKFVDRISGHALKNGGIITVNWHDRSIVAERQWDGLYRRMISEWSQQDAWFPCMADAASWFRKRRAYRFGANGEIIGDSSLEHSDLPDLVCRTHNMDIESNKPLWDDERITLSRKARSAIG